MRSRTLVASIAAVAVLGGGVTAWAVTPAESTVDVQFTPSKTNAGTKKRPAITNLKVVIKGGTTTGEGQPATSTALNTILPGTWRINSERWPRARRCSITEVNRAKSTAPCPRGSKVGSGVSNAAFGEGGGNQRLTVTAYVIKNGDLGFFLRGTDPTQVAQMIQGVTSNGNRLSVKIPQNLQEPVPGVTTGITLLTVNFKAITRLRGGRRIGILQTTGCKNRQWKFGFVDVYRGGATKRDTDIVRCTK